MTESSGFIDFTFGNETFQTWYKVVGDLESSSRPLIVLHGGPGMAHNYLHSHIDLHASYNIPIIFYDQIGIGRSTHLRDKPESFWTMEFFVAELHNVLTHLGVSSNFDLLGHSWGGMLALAYAADRKPQGLKRIVLASAPASLELWEVGTNSLLDALPGGLGEVLRKHEREGTTDDDEYQRGMLVFYKKHGCKVDPWPKEVLDSVASTEEDPTVYHTMLGPSEFCITGTLKTWSIIDRLSSIDYPTLVINSFDDSAQDACVLPLFHTLPRVKWVQFSRSSHMPFWEERERYIKVVGDFLTL